MPRQNIDYSKTITYKIVCKDVNITDLYVGSTTDFVRRRHQHKYHTVNNTNKSHLYVYDFINKNGDWNNFEMIEIEKYNALDHNDALKRERYWLEELKATLNAQTPSRPKKEYKKEWKEKNKGKIQEQDKIYREKNKDTNITCECGCIVKKHHIARHKKTPKHEELINKLLI